MTLSRQYLWRKSIQQRCEQLVEREIQAWDRVIIETQWGREGVTAASREACYKWFDAELDRCRDGLVNEAKFECFIGSLYPKQTRPSGPQA